MAKEKEGPTVPFRFTIPPNTSTPLILKTQPHAVCMLLAQEPAIQTSELKLHADSEGNIRFHLKPLGQFSKSLKFVIDSEVNEHTTQYSLEVISGFQPNHEMPAPPEDDMAVPTGSVLQPGLSDDKATRMTDQQLFEGRYSPRPNRKKAPHLFEHWRKSVARPCHVVPSRCAPAHGRQADLPLGSTAKTTLNWSGFVLKRSESAGIPREVLGDPYDTVYGEWNVPFANGEGICALWVGLGDEDSSYLVQAGTSGEITTVSLYGIPVMTVATYYAWSEVLPEEKPSVMFTDLPVYPGDLMMVDAWIGNASGGIDLDGQYPYFSLKNVTRGIRVVRNPGFVNPNITGNEADWVMERPTIPYPASSIFGAFHPSALANYGSAMMLFCFAHTSNPKTGGEYVCYYQPSLIAITMTNDSGTVLSTATSLSSLAIRFDWKDYQ